MAIGDAAAAAGMDTVPSSGKVNKGYDEINKTRDYLANRILSIWTIAKGGTGASTKSGARTNLGITSGTAAPSGGDIGDIYLKII